MTAINFVVRGLPGFAIHGDSLKADPIAAWEIMPTKGMMGAPIQECEPPQFTPVSDDETTDSSASATATDGADKVEGQNAQVDVDVELDTQQAEFAAFTDSDGDVNQ